jgi:TolB protein
MSKLCRLSHVVSFLLILMICCAPTQRRVFGQDQRIKACSQIALIGLPEKPTETATNGWDIFVMNDDGSNLQRLTQTEHDEKHPSWSNDGKHMLFDSDRDRNEELGLGSYDLYAMNSDGTDVRRLTSFAKGIDAFQPDWSPNGKWIAYVTEAKAQVRGIEIMSVDGGHRQKLNVEGLLPSWSPDSTQIVYTGVAEAEQWNSEIYIMDVDGSNVKRLTNSEGGDGQARWSPDGQWIVFVSKRDQDQQNKYEGSSDIYAMSRDGDQVKRLTVDGGDSPSWSPDGSQIVYVGSSGITVMNSDGTQPNVILSGHYHEPKWSPWLCPQTTE